MDTPRLNKRYDRLWRKAERLVEAFLNEQLKAIKAETGEANSVPVREIHVATQCLKRIYEGRQAASIGEGNDPQSVESNESAESVADELSRRIQALYEEGGSDAGGEDPL